MSNNGIAIRSVAFAVMLCNGCAHAQPPTTTNPAPASGDSPYNSQPTSPQSNTLSTTSSADDILDALDRRGQDLKTLIASVKLTETDPGLGDSWSRGGKFWLEIRADGSTRGRVLFTRKDTEKRPIEEKIEYVLDGRSLIDRNYPRKKEVTRIILRPGEKMNLLKLGEGPFPLPIGQKREDVLRSFDVTKPELAKDDPPGTVHIQLVPKSDTSLARKFKSIDVWVDVVEQLPRVIKTVARNGTTEQMTELNDVEVNGSITDSDFQPEKIDDKWTRVEEAYQN